METPRHLFAGMRRRHASDRMNAWLFMLPLFILLGVLIVIPVLGTFRDSFMRDVPYLPQEFIGLRNYSALFHDPGFLQSLRFTALFVLVSVPLELVLGMIMALVLNASFPGRALMRAVVLIPWAIPAAVSGRIFELTYNFSYGAANAAVRWSGLADQPLNWLGTPMAAFFAVVIADAWQTTPFVALILLAGLSAIDEDLYRQARIDRTTFLQRFRYLTLPLIRPVLIVTLLFRTIMAVRIFDVIYVLTGGGPGGATDAASLFAFRYFSAADYGYGAAASIVLFLGAALLSVLYIKFGRFGEELR